VPIPDRTHVAFAAGGVLGAPGLLAAQDGGGLFTPDLGLSVWTIAVFLLVLFILGKFAWRPMLSALDAREKGIQGSIDEAGKLRAEAQEMLEEHRRQLADARRQAQEIVASGREAGERLRREVETRAREESERMLERARSEIERERDHAMDALRRESVELALSAASRLLREKLDSSTDRALVEDYLGRLDRPSAEA